MPEGEGLGLSEQEIAHIRLVEQYRPNTRRSTNDATPAAGLGPNEGVKQEST